MTLQLELAQATSIPIEVEGIMPETIREKSLDQIKAMPIFVGNRQRPLGEWFQVQGDPSDNQMVWDGDMSGVHWIGTKMSAGTIHIRGNAGRHLGSEMSAGTIRVDGNAGDWVGGEMRGGLIQVGGRAGHLVGSAYRGSRRGMTGGTILIAGQAGNEVGHSMRRGLVAVGGDLGDLAGLNMIAGTILTMGRCGIRHGAGMRRGTIGLFGPETPPLLPTFRYACRLRPSVFAMIFRGLRRWGFHVPGEIAHGEYALYHGDMIEGGRGEIFLRASCSVETNG